MTKLRFIIYLICVCVCWPTVSAQDVYKKKNVLKQVRALNKAQNYSKAAETLNAAFSKHEQARHDADLLAWAMNMQHQLAGQENRKIYLNQKPDTASYFTHILNTYSYGLACDTADNLPNQKNKVKPRYASLIGTRLATTRNNLRSGGKYFYKGRHYSEAYTFFDMYLNTIGHRLIAAAEGKSGLPADMDADSIEIARLAVISAYGAQATEKVLEHVNTALRDTTNRQLIYELQAKAYEMLGDTASYIGTLDKAFKQYPLGQFFYSSLITYYDTRADYQSSLRVLDTLVETDSLNRTFWYLKGKMHQCLADMDSAIVSYNRAITLQPDDAQSYAALGSVYLEQAHQFYDSTNLRIGAKNYATNRKRLNAMYQQARKAYEQSRKHDSKAKELWLTALQEIYFKLNMGRELRNLEQ